jgi:hypothetical protein
MTDAKTPWELVLADVEADVQRSEALLAPAVLSYLDPAKPLAPAELMLPAGTVTLPPLSDMPPVPPELLNRITTLRERIIALRAELEAELAEASQIYALRSTALHPAMVTAAPQFVDRRI